MTTAAAAEGSPESRALATLREIFESGRPLTYIFSPEEHRITQLLLAAAAAVPGSPPVWTWAVTLGLQRHGDEGVQPDTASPRAVLDFIDAYDGPGYFHLKDFHEPMRESAEIRRRLRDLYESCFDKRKFVVISAPVKEVPAELERTLVFLQLRSPDLRELVGFLRHESERIIAAGGTADGSEETLFQLARALQGLTLDEARHAVRRALADAAHLGSESVPALLEEKRLLVNRTGMVEYVANGTALEQVGGLDILKKWLLERRKLFQLRDSLSGDIVPKGLLIMGVSGCGKSLCVKAVSSCFELPLYRIDMTEIFSGRHGNAEGAFVKACRMLEELAPAVVWFDEIEMAITSSATAGEQGRIFAFFLTWMQEKTRGLFVAATANRIDLLPAEMIRKGRFDEVFFVDLPLDEERADIFRIHLQRRGVDPANFNIERLKKFTKGWTGAEIEQCVVAAFTAARLEDREVVDDDILNATATVVPLSKTMKEQVDHIRTWAYDRAVRASPREYGR